MELTLKIISDEKFEVTITEGENTIFNDSRYHTYMDEVLVNSDNISETINHLKSLFGDFTVTQNDFL